MSLRHVRRCARGVSLIETLVVLFIIGIMMSMYLPALSAARAKVQVNVCQNNVHQLRIGLSQYIDAKRRFPLEGAWTVDLLPYIEEQPLAAEMAASKGPNATFRRPQVMQCPMQNEFSSRIDGVGFCHYVLVVDRPTPIYDDNNIPWEVQDRELLDGELPEQPWWVGPEISYFAREALLLDKPGPHTDGKYVTLGGMRP